MFTFGSSPKTSNWPSVKILLAVLIISRHFFGVSSTFPARNKQAALVTYCKTVQGKEKISSQDTSFKASVGWNITILYRVIIDAKSIRSSSDCMQRQQERNAYIYTYIHTLLRLPSTWLFSHNVNYHIILVIN